MCSDINRGPGACRRDFEEREKKPQRESFVDSRVACHGSAVHRSEVSQRHRFRSAGRWAGGHLSWSKRQVSSDAEKSFLWYRLAKALLLMKGERDSDWVLDLQRQRSHSPGGSGTERLKRFVGDAGPWLSDIGWRRGGGGWRDHRRKIVDWMERSIFCGVLTLLSSNGAEQLGIGADNSRHIRHGVLPKRRLKWPLEPQLPQAPEAHIR